MAQPMPPKRRVTLTEILTIDDLINFVSLKAHTRPGRIVTGASSIVLLGAIIFAPIIIRSHGGGSGSSSTPAVPVVTVPTSANNQTAYIDTKLPIDPTPNDNNRYGPKTDTATTPVTHPAAVAPVTPTTAAPPPAVVVQAPQTPQTAAPVTFPQVTFPPATAAPPPPVTTPPLTAPKDGPVPVG